MAYKSYRPEDFEAIVTKHENRLYRTALAITGNMSDAEDIVQEAFLRAYERAPDFETEEHEKAWLIRVTVNLCNSRLRSPWRKRIVPLLDSYPTSEPEQHELLEQIMTLPTKYRTVIHLFYGSMSIVGVEINPRVNKPNVKRGVFKFEGTFFCLADSFHEETVY
jgi:RNA polymerase sigma-70 factor (ECF subfamily)